MKQARLYLSLILPSLLEDNPTRTFIFFSYFRYGYFIIPKAANLLNFVLLHVDLLKMLNTLSFFCSPGCQLSVSWMHGF